MDINNRYLPFQERPEEVPKHTNIFRIAAFLSYIIGFIYFKHVLCSTVEFAFEDADSTIFISYLIFAIVFIVGTEVFAYLTGVGHRYLKENNKSVVEPIIFAICIVLQTVSFVAWQFHEDWEMYQFLMWHFTIIYYVLARTGCLSAGRSGIMFLMDCFQGCVWMPLKNFCLRTRAIFSKDESREKKEEGNGAEHKVRKRMSVSTFVTICFSIAVAMILCWYAAAQLSQASSTFGDLGVEIFELMETKFSVAIDQGLYFVFSVPVSCWLYGLVAGCLKARKSPCTDKQFEDNTKEFHMLPSYSAYIIIGSVCLLYAVFFGTAVFDFVYHKGFFAETAHEASVRAVGSFWNLIRVVVMNFCIIAATCLFSKKALWDEKKTRILGTVLIIFAFLFAVLAACNLCGVYIAIFGITPRRILSSWVVFNIIAWCILMLIRFYKKIPAAQIGIILAALSFSVVVCFRF